MFMNSVINQGRRIARKKAESSSETLTPIYQTASRLTPEDYKNSGASVRQRTIPTEWPPLIGEVSANFSG
jgi:hypothetical protein